MSRITAIIVMGLLLYEQPPTPLPAPTRYCVLAIPPSQIVKAARLEPLYCNHDQEGECHPYQLGWLVVSDAVPCD